MLLIALAPLVGRSYLLGQMQLRASGVMKWIAEVDLKDASGSKSHVRVDVLPIPSDTTRVAGLVRMDDREGGPSGLPPQRSSDGR